ncbi:MAG TPA: hypothetical protein VK956_15760, partial [Verrucomicrobium sp.]|nr:hypothetical protein [Verrucomicrobium sp.]
MTWKTRLSLALMMAASVACATLLYRGCWQAGRVDVIDSIQFQSGKVLEIVYKHDNRWDSAGRVELRCDSWRRELTELGEFDMAVDLEFEFKPLPGGQMALTAKRKEFPEWAFSVDEFRGVIDA